MTLGLAPRQGDLLDEVTRTPGGRRSLTVEYKAESAPHPAPKD